jgi:hypothetical protein
MISTTSVETLSDSLHLPNWHQNWILLARKSTSKGTEFFA